MKHSKQPYEAPCFMVSCIETEGSMSGSVYQVDDNKAGVTIEKQDVDESFGTDNDFSNEGWGVAPKS